MLTGINQAETIWVNSRLRDMVVFRLVLAVSWSFCSGFMPWYLVYLAHTITDTEIEDVHEASKIQTHGDSDC